MHKKTFLTILCFMIGINISLQAGDFKKPKVVPDSAKYNWMPTAVIGVNISQIAFSNWKKGGDNSLTWTAFGDFNLLYKSDNWSTYNQLKLEYGQTKIGSDDFKTNDNELYLENVISYIAGWNVDPYFGNLFRTQLAAGFNYDKEPYQQTSDFFDPAYITQSIGFLYDPSPAFKTRLGVAIEEVFTNHYRQYTDDAETEYEMETFRFSSGMESVTDLDLKIDENLVYKSKLRLYTRFESLDIWDVRWDNTIIASINSFVNVKLTYQLLYEHESLPKTQMKEALQLGVAYKFY